MRGFPSRKDFFLNFPKRFFMVEYIVNDFAIFTNFDAAVNVINGIKNGVKYHYF